MRVIVRRYQVQRRAGWLLPIGLLIFSGCAVRPQPLEVSEIQARVVADTAAMVADQEPVHGTIDLYEVIARGLKYNLDKRLKLFELGLADDRLRLVHADFLPSVTANAGYRVRDNELGSSSRSLITGDQSLEVSTSQDKRIRSADLQMMWNVLDFGLTYIKAKQEGC